MDVVLPMESTLNVSLPNLNLKKKKVLSELKSKAEQAKLNLIYTGLEEADIPFERNFTTVNELNESLKKNLPAISYNKVIGIFDRVNNQIDSTIDGLANSSTNAFTNLMTSDLSKTICKTLGISLAGRTALTLAPTVASKAAVGAGLAGYGIYRVVKNRDEIKKSNENTELNTILSEIETTKNGDAVVDTRLNHELQELSRKYLKDNNIEFKDTGYRSLRQVIYSLPYDKKRGLVDLLNNSAGKGINVQERISKAKRKLNVIATSVTTAGLGTKLGMDAASAVNGVDPGLLAGAINGTFLGAWVEANTQKEWFAAVAGGLGFIGTEVLERLPIVGSIAQTAFAAENVATLATLGATGGLLTGATLGVASGLKQVYNYARNKKVNRKFLKIDAEKYKDDDLKEINLIKQNLKNNPSITESLIVDIVNGYLKDEGITLSTIPKTINELTAETNKLNPSDMFKAKTIIKKVYTAFQNKSLREQFIKAGKISVGLFTAGLATMSVYDIIKGGTFLPELSKSIFPENNIHAPVEAPLDASHDLNEIDNSTEYNKAQNLNNEFKNGSTYVDDIEHKEKTVTYVHENTGSNYLMDEASNAYANSKRLPGESYWSWFWRQVGISGRMNVATDYALGDNVVDKVTEVIGWEVTHELVPDRNAIIEKLNTLSPEDLLFFTRYMNGQNGNDDLTITIKEALKSSLFTNKITDYIGGFETIQRNHDFVNNLTKMVATGVIPTSVFSEAVSQAQKHNTNEDFAISDEETKKHI